MSSSITHVNYNRLSASERREKREEYIAHQNDNCYWCGLPLYQEPVHDQPILESLFPKNFFQYRVHLQHDHDTGMTEGTVHAYCNAVMWQYYGR